MCLRPLIIHLAVLLALAPFVRPAESKVSNVPALGSEVGKIDFSSQIRPIISSKCFACHGPDNEARKANLRLDSLGTATQEHKGRRAIVPGKPEESELLKRLLSHDPDEVMPPPEAKNPVKPTELALLRRWIAQGADYTPHWAWQKPTAVALPRVRNSKWPRNGIDPFILERLEKAGVAPSAEADRPTIARRVAFDLTGLPPEPGLLNAFLNDHRPHAYECFVDQLLASPHYGERWARVWLDLARYADSSGYGSDPLRPNIWPFRDWIIGAFNRNLSYEQFTREQLAGDLLPGATEDQVIATSFHRNTMTNTEGGTEDEEWRVAAVKDRANVTAQVWMGLTMGCAQCHSHKFDPITQREYYSFYGFFNQTADNDQPDESPTRALFSLIELKRRAELQTKIGELETRYRVPNAAYESELAAWALEAAKPIAWDVLHPKTALSVGKEGAQLEIAPDHSVSARGLSPDRDLYCVTVPVPAGTTAFRLEALVAPDLPNQGPGRTEADGNFVVNDLRAYAASTPSQPVKARFVRLAKSGEKLQLAVTEVQVFSQGRNIAPLGTAKASSAGYLADAAKAIDGNTDGNLNSAHSTSQTLPQKNPWWQLDLGSEQSVDELALWSPYQSEQLKGAHLELRDDAGRTVWETELTDVAYPVARVGPAAARELTLRNATSDYFQPDFPAGKSIDRDTARNSGWAIGGATGKDHALAFELAEPLSSNTIVLFHLAQNYGEKHTLGHFRFSATSQALPVRLLPGTVAAAVAATPAERTEALRQALDDHYRPLSKTFGELAKTLSDTRQKRENIGGTPLPVMRELGGDQRRQTALLHKGNYLTPGDPVTAGVPAAFHPWRQDQPTNRLGLATWLTDRENPLTARVAVNRYWSQLMGQGLVESEEDFGTQGTLPTHRELLDWLAVVFQSPSGTGTALQPALDWDMKALVKLMVTSATYRQSSVATAAQLERDPRNRLYGRALRRRLDAEAVRDQALAVSGLLAKKIGGPSVYPFQPEGLWRAAFNGQRSWATSEGEDRYRRGIYTFLRRTVPYPSMATFDAPSRETCTLRRLPTNTPLQAYVTMNDPVFVEAAQALGRRLIREGGENPTDRIRFGLKLLTGRTANDAQIATLLQLYHSELANYQTLIDDAVQLTTRPLGPLPFGWDAAEAAAWTAVANVQLNLDAVLTRG